jgi:single-stranded-DNA-specific exonuclease
MKYRWTLPESAPSGVAAKLASTSGVSPRVAECLVNRGITEPDSAARFLNPRLKDLSDPLLFPNMAIAVDRLLLARQRGESLVIFGDYDVDGVTSVALLMETLTALGWKPNYYLPRRLDEGYGLTREAAEHCRQKYPMQLLLAVDCGSTAVETIGWLREQGTEVIVLDHHQISSPPPPAVALVNPRLADPLGQDAECCSAGLAFKMAHALVKRLRTMGDESAAKFDVRDHLDLVALGTIADLVPLRGENRIFASAGLERLTKTQRPGLIALKSVARCPPLIGSYEVGFQLGPRLNAAGRLEDAEDSLRLLLARDSAAALPLAQRLDERNRRRQEIERDMAEEVMRTVSARFDGLKHFAIVEGHASWHIGVVGIVASRVVKRFHRPTLILGGDGELWRGSGRSIEGFDLAAALRSCGDLLARHGGHAMAAGVTAQPDRVELLRERLNELARLGLKPEHLEPCLKLDGEVDSDDLAVARLEELDCLAPTGQGNPPVQWMIRGLRLSQPPRRMGSENRHAKLYVTDGRAALEAVWWNCADAPMPEGRFDLAFTPGINEYRGNRVAQLRVLDWRPSV